MKWAVYLVLLANIAWFAWHYRQPPAETALEAAHSEGIAQLVLLKERRERDAAAPPKPAPEPEPEPGSTPSARPAAAACYTIGPFEARNLALRAQGRLADAALDTRQRVDDSAQRPGYWVLLPPFPTRAEAVQAIERLKQRAVSDYFLVAAGEHKNGVSLGVFSERARAVRRLREMRRLGFAPALEEVQLPDRKLWLDTAPGAQPPEDVFRALRRDYPGVHRESVACPLPG